jgi:hypothetical protein
LIKVGRPKAIHHHVVAPLSRVDELEALIGVAAVRREGGQVVGDGAGVAIVPVGDPGQRLVRVKIHGVGAAAEFLRCQVDVTSQRLANALETLAET